MTWAALLLLVAYVALKGGQFALTGRASGYRDEPVGFRPRLSAGEPALLIVAALLTVPPALAATWYHQHKFSAALRDSLSCYGLISVYRNTPEIMRSNGEHAVYLSLEDYRATTFDAAGQLGLTVGPLQRRLDDAAMALRTERSRNGEKLRRAKVAETQRCLHPPSESPNA